MALAQTIDTTSAAERFARDGYICPVNVVSRDDALAYRAEFESLTDQIASRRLGNKGQLNHAHTFFPFVSEIIRHPAILQTVKAILGHDLLVWATTFFTKEPRTESFVSWHQDLRYWGLSGDAEVAVWVALGAVHEEQGCMRFVPQSHRMDLLEHRDTFDEKNFLTRGQEAVIDIDESKTVLAELDPGQASLHHGRLLHASGPNRSDERRVGMVINYIAPEMRQTVGSRDFAMLVQGEDRFGHFEMIPEPTENFSAEGLAWHQRLLGAHNETIYDGAGVTET